MRNLANTEHTVPVWTAHVCTRNTQDTREETRLTMHVIDHTGHIQEHHEIHFTAPL